MWLHIPIARENVIVVALGRASPLDYRRYQWKPRANISTLGESVPGVADQASPVGCVLAGMEGDCRRAKKVCISSDLDPDFGYVLSIRNTSWAR